MDFFYKDDGSIENESGEMIFYSKERFLSDIYYGDNCFLCGCSKNGGIEFNDEHVIPKWLLRKHNLFNEYITLPNGVKRKYGSDYVVDTCKDCNSYLGMNIEEKVKKIFDGGFLSIRDALSTGNVKHIYIWMCLIFFKTHLIDARFRYHLDTRKEEKISDLYDIETLHHIYCLIRSMRFNIEIDSQCFGSIILLKTDKNRSITSYDYQDLYEYQTVMIRSDDFALITVINDVGISERFFKNHLDKITAEISSIQALEVFANLSFINDKLAYRPNFFTITKNGSRPIISVECPEIIDLIEYDRNEFGLLFYRLIREYHENISDIDLEEIKKGNRTFLFDQNGLFNKNSLYR